jgi:hypothetical protein
MVVSGLFSTCTEALLPERGRDGERETETEGKRNVDERECG